VFSFNSTYELPFGQSLSGAAAQLLKGWQVNGIVNVTSGVPVSIENTAALNRSRDLSTGSASRPNLVAGRSNNPVLGGPDKYYDVSAFQMQDAGFYGNLGRDTLIGPGFGTVDFAVVKKFFTMKENLNIQFRAECFNLLNRANFDIPDRIAFNNANGVSNATAGRIVRTTSSSRQLQFGLKITF
jgi:hypothetical protein